MRTQRTLKVCERKTYEGVDVVPDTGLPVGSPRTHGVIRVVLGAPDSGSQEVTPTLTHSACLAPSETSRVRGSTSQPRA